MRHPFVIFLFAGVIAVGASHQMLAGQNPADESAAIPAFSPDGRQIAYTLGHGPAESQVHIMSRDGTHDRTVTTGSESSQAAQFSPDGKRLLYRAAPAERPSDMNSLRIKLITVGIDGSDRRVVDAAGVVAIAEWSPDSRQIMFTGAKGGPRGPISVSIVDADGSHPIELASGPAGSNIMLVGAWAPDGRRIAFAAPTTAGEAIFLASRDGSHRKQLTTAIAHQSFPVWSPDSKTIVFAGGESAGRQFGVGQHLYVIGADGSGLRQVLAQAVHVSHISFSPDGKRILFEDTREGNTDIFVMDRDGTGEHRLTTEPGLDEVPSWSPDGRAILFQSDREAGRRGSNIFIMQADGTGVRRLR